jgi:hypothetical protein
MGEIGRNLQIVQERIERAAERSGRTAGDVTLVAVTKTVNVERIREAIAAGVRHFGENRVQEAQVKYAPRGTALASAEIVAREEIILHMIGSLQRNKARDAAALFDYVHSVDRPQLLDALDRAAGVERPNKPLPVLIEVNITGEESKSGVPPEGLPALADSLASCGHLQGVGLMSIARLGASERELRTTFSRLRRLLGDLRASHPGHWQQLSMGMSDDYEIAIEEGATMVRLGRAIFGERG